MRKPSSRSIAALALAALACGVIALSCTRNSTPHGPPASLPTTGPMATLTVKVTDLRNHSGQLIFGVFTQAHGFPSDATQSVNWQIHAADADSVTFTCTLPPGRYGVSVLHDENSNNKLDTNFAGIPKEGYGVTNNPKPKFRAAKFEESTFDLPASGVALTLSLQYF